MIGQTPAPNLREIKVNATIDGSTDKSESRQTMTKVSQKRWMTNLMAEVEKCDTQMPWARGARRQAFIARRKAAEAAAETKLAA